KEATLLRVSVGGSEISGSPVAVGKGLYDGRASVANGCIEGWVTERLFGFKTPVVKVVDQDGDIVGEGLAEVASDSADPLFAPARFRIPIADRCFGRPESSLRIFANGVQFAQLACKLTLRGYLDHVSRDRCAGWLLSPEAPARSFELDVYRNGELV